MLHPALITLLRLRGRGLVRRVLRGVRTPSGLLFAIFGALMFALWVVPALVNIATGEKVPPEPIQRFGPALIALIVLSNLFNRNAQHATSFTPAEIDTLFAAPFSRRELVTYKVAVVFASSVGLGLFLSIMLLSLATSWLFGFIAWVLVLLLVNLVSMAALLGGRYVALLLRTRTQRGLFAVVAAALAIGTVLTIPFNREAGLRANVMSALDSPVVSAAVAPFSVFTTMLTAQSWSLFASVAAAGALMCVAMFALIVRLDAGAVEATIARGRQYHARVQRARRRAGLYVSYGTRSARWRIRPLPWLTGAGPILHRQLTTALRSLPSLGVNLGIPLAILTVVVVGAGRFGPDTATFGLVLGLLFFTLILPGVMLFDFRGDLDQMDWIKMLPLRPVPMVLGQLAAPVIGVTLAQGFLLALAALVGGVPAHVLIAAALLILPFNVVNVAIDNGMFLAYPTRKLAVGFADLAGFGRQMLLFVAKALVLTVVCGAAFLIGGLAWLLTGRSFAAFVTVACLALAAAGACAVPVVASLFSRFDVSRDMPG